MTKLISEMTDSERVTFFADVRTWTDETYPRLLAHVDAWSESEVKDFDTGLLLASAMQQARTFCAKAQLFTSTRALDMLYRYMQDVAKYDTHPADIVDNRSGIVRKTYRRVAATPVTTEDTDGIVTTTDPVKRADEIVKAVAAQYTGARPAHYDSWKQSMSPALQEMVNGLQDMYLQLAAARSQAEKLDDDPRATQADRASANQRVIFWDEQINAVHATAEQEWQALQAGTDGSSASEESTATDTATVPSDSSEGTTKKRTRKKK